jgi:hypothetical protein
MNNDTYIYLIPTDLYKLQEYYNIIFIVMYSFNMTYNMYNMIYNYDNYVMLK